MHTVALTTHETEMKGGLLNLKWEMRPGFNPHGASPLEGANVGLNKEVWATP